MIKFLKSSLFLLIVFGINGMSAMVGDNRYFPWYYQPQFRTFDKRSMMMVQGFFMTADEAIGDAAKETKGIHELWGTYDLIKMGQAAQEIGYANPLRSYWQTFYKIEWQIKGKVQAQGVSFLYDHALTRNITVGFSGLFMHASSNQEFIIPTTTKNDMQLQSSDEDELDRDRRAIHKLFGFENSQYSVSHTGDFEAHARLGWLYEYTLKCRQVDTGLSLGLLIPSGQKRDPENSASLPFGSNGHMGVYGQGDVALELKEDWVLGTVLRLGGRFSKTETRRLSVKGEPQPFGATQGLVMIDPGLQFLWEVYFSLGDIRDGLGFQTRYTMSIHGMDRWIDQRTDKTVVIKLDGIENKTAWRAEYFTLSALYDFGRVIVGDSLRPVVTLSWDIPVHFMVARDVSKTNKICLGIECHF